MAASHQIPSRAEGISAEARPGPAFRILLVLTLAGPLLLGGAAGLPSEGILRSLGSNAYCLLAFLLAGATLLVGIPLPRWRLLAAPGAALLLIFLLGLAQLVPIPERFLRPIASANLTIYHETAALLGVYGISPAPAPRVSIAPPATAGTALRWLGGFALLVAAAGVVTSRARRRLLFASILGAGGIEIAIAAARDTPGRFHGTFAEPEELAAFLQVPLAAAIAFVWTEVLTGRDRAFDVAAPSERFERRFPALAWRIVVWLALVAGIGLTGSSRGLAGAGVATLWSLSLGALRRRRLDPNRAFRFAGLLLGSVLAAAVFCSVTGRLDSKLGRGAETSIRDATRRAFVAFPAFGSGLGTFREAFRRVQTADIATVVENGGSDALELAVTGGMAGAALGIALTACALCSTGLAWARQRHREERSAALAGSGAVAGLALHAAVGTAFATPAVGWTLAIFVGAAVAAGART